MAKRVAGSPRLLFITTSLGTKWESYSQSLISLGYPSQQRIVIDGTKNWWPLMFLNHALEQDSDYVIHIDEDCFLYDPIQLDKLLAYLEGRDDIILAGTPDGGTYYRAHNPYACNLFFIVFKTRALRDLLKSKPDWVSAQFKESFKSAVALDVNDLDQSRISYDNYEPYYGLFWTILDSGKKIAYLRARLNPELLSTDVHLNGEEKPLARHMWYLRSWNMTELGPSDKIPHRERYLKLQQEIHYLFGDNFKFKIILLANNLRRITKNSARKTSRAILDIPRSVWRRIDKRKRTERALHKE